MAGNSFVTPVKVMREVGRRLVNNLKFGNNVNRSYNDEFKSEGAKVGYTVNARLPQKYRVNKGQALVTQGVTDQVVPITITDQANVGLEFSMASLKLEIDDYKKRYVDPAVDVLINTYDFDGLSRMYKEVPNFVGTPGTVPNGTAQVVNKVYLDAGVKLTNLSIPVESRIAMLTPAMHAELVGANMTLFHPGSMLQQNYRTGQFANQEQLGIAEWFLTQNIARHTVGPLGGVPAANGLNQTGASIITDGWTAAAALRLRDGDIINFAGVNSVNALNYDDTGQLRDFRVLGNVSSDASGNATIPIYPPIITTGAEQNVTGPAVDGALITIFGHASSHANKVSPQALLYHPDAFASVMVDLELPGGLWVAERISNKAMAIAVRFLKDYEIRSDQSPARLDIMYGWAGVRKDFAIRIVS